MKKCFMLVLVFIIFCFSVYADESDNTSDSTQLIRIQTFRWSHVEKAKKYEVLVEQKVGTLWNEIHKVETTENRAQVQLTPGDYRVKINTFNMLNKIASSTKWVDFAILDKTEPYLNEQTFEKTNDVLVLKRSNTKSISDVNITQEQQNVFPKNSTLLTVSGVNIFFEKTHFKLIPIENESFPSMLKNRKEIVLPVIDRDSEKNQLYVLVDWNNIVSGYYKFTVSNTEKDTDAFDVLVMPELPVEFNSGIYRYSKRYKVNTLDVQRQNEKVSLKVKVKHLQYDTKFSLVPYKANIPYPFESEAIRSEVPMEILSTKDATNSEVEIDLSFDSSIVETGYYKIVASSKTANESSLDILLNVKALLDKTPIIKKVQSKYYAKENEIKFTLSGSRLSNSTESEINNTSVMLISQYDGISENKKIPLSIENINKKATKLVAIVNADLIDSGMYTLMLETKDGSTTNYIDINEKYAVTSKKLSDEQIIDIFMRPEETEDSQIVKDKNINVIPGFEDSSKWTISTKNIEAISSNIKTQKYSLKNNIFVPINDNSNINETYQGLEISADFGAFPNKEVSYIVAKTENSELLQKLKSNPENAIRFYASQNKSCFWYIYIEQQKEDGRISQFRHRIEPGDNQSKENIIFWSNFKLCPNSISDVIDFNRFKSLAFVCVSPEEKIGGEYQLIIVEPKLDKSILEQPTIMTEFNAGISIKDDSWANHIGVRFFDKPEFAIDGNLYFDKDSSYTAFDVSAMFSKTFLQFKPFVGIGVGFLNNVSGNFNLRVPACIGFRLFKFIDFSYCADIYFDLGDFSLSLCSMYGINIVIPIQGKKIVRFDE